MESNPNQQTFSLGLARSRKYGEAQHNGKYPLPGFIYSISLQPLSEYWRLGLRFYREENENLSSGSNDVDYNLYVGAGVENRSISSEVEEEEISYDFGRMILGHNGISATQVVPSLFAYEPKSPVILSFHLDEGSPMIHVSLSGISEQFSFFLPDTQFKYFTLYAWSEKEPVELTGVINREASLSTSTATTSSTTPLTTPAPDNTNATTVNHYLIKLRDETWNTRSFQPGMLASFDSYLENKERRPDYNLFEKLKAGDKLIGYECESEHEIVCIFIVTDPLSPVETKVSLQIERCIQPPIPLAHFRQKVDFTPKLSNGVVTRLFELNKTQFDNLLTPRPVNDPHTQVLTSFTSDDHQQTKDQLAFSYDILSFATIIALKKVHPPLAIGLFGNWGSGKSYFMEQLEREIDAKAKSPGDFFVQNVIQVKFNSWHYSDSNLWASLITEIFDRLYAYASEKKKIDELEKLSETLQIANLQKGAAEIKKQELETRQQELQKEQEDKREQLKDISGLALAKLILKDPKVQQDLQSLDNQNVETVFQQGEKVDELIVEVNKEVNRWRYFFSTWLGFKGRWVYVILLVFILFIIFWLVQNVQGVAITWKSLTAKLAAWATFVTTLLSTGWRAYQPVRKRFDEAYSRLVSLKKTIDSREQKDSPEVEENKRQLKSVKESIETLNNRIQTTEKALEDIRSGRRLLEFIEQRSRDEQYAKQLGLISWIRKDFKKLDELLRQLYEVEDEKKRKEMNPTDIKLRIDRIVLYIDDLDRCNEDIVVNVLEAVHLLLAFPLFVVVVGVDPRWLNKSLTNKYPFFSNNGVKKQNKLAGADPVHKGEQEEEDEDLVPISSFDYLEKIFQIPFALKPITKEGREGLIGYLVEAEIEKKDEPMSITTPQATHPLMSQTGNNTGNAKQQPQPTDVGAETKSSSTIGESILVNTSPNTNAVISEDARLTALKAMKLSQEEVEYMKDVSILFGHTPRTIKRFVNIYRLIKSNQGLDPLTDFKATLLLLAIIVGCPERAQTFILELEKSNHQTFLDLINETSLTDVRSWMLDQLNNTLIPKTWREQSISSLQANQELISRFSFRTYAM